VILDPLNRLELPVLELRIVSQLLAESIQAVFLIALAIALIVFIWSWFMPKENPEMLSNKAAQPGQEKVVPANLRPADELNG
jgi:predicted lipid-binding transport protein (Tim44 family)